MDSLMLLAAMMMLAAGVLKVFDARQRKEHEPPRMWIAVLLLFTGFYMLFAAIRT
jgi:uncharacterized membrane-anchored protein